MQVDLQGRKSKGRSGAALVSMFWLVAGAAWAQDVEVSTPRAFEFSERVVAGGPADSLIVRHLVLRGSQRAIGARLAELAETNHGTHPVELEPARTRERAAFYREHYPAHFQRGLGLGDHFALEENDGLDPFLVPYNLPKAFACSVAYFPPNECESGHATLSRNYDFASAGWETLAGPGQNQDARGTTQDPYIVEVYPDEGYASLYLCAYELLGGCIDGINSQGLTVALLADAPKDGPSATHGWQRGLSEIEVARFLLDTCADVDEARAALATIEFYYLMIPCHYIIGDAAGRSFVWEYSGDRKERRVHEGGGEPQWITNHPLHEADHERVDPEDSTYERYRRLGHEIASATGKRSLDEIKRANSCVRMKETGPTRMRTLWHALYDCTDRSLEVDFWLGDGEAGQAPQRSGYLKFRLARE